MLVYAFEGDVKLSARLHRSSTNDDDYTVHSNTIGLIVSADLPTTLLLQGIVCSLQFILGLGHLGDEGQNLTSKTLDITCIGLGLKSFK